MVHGGGGGSLLKSTLRLLPKWWTLFHTDVKKSLKTDIKAESIHTVPPPMHISKFFVSLYQVFHTDMLFVTRLQLAEFNMLNNSGLVIRS